jgi:hypothetical protein
MVQTLQACLYTVVGLGVLTFQRAQEQRQELVRSIQPVHSAIEDRCRFVEGRLTSLLGKTSGQNDVRDVSNN